MESDEAKLVRLAMLLYMFPTSENWINFRSHLRHCTVLAADLPGIIDVQILDAATAVASRFEGLQEAVFELQGKWSARTSPVTPAR